MSQRGKHTVDKVCPLVWQWRNIYILLCSQCGLSSSFDSFTVWTAPLCFDCSWGRLPWHWPPVRALRRGRTPREHPRFGEDSNCRTIRAFMSESPTHQCSIDVRTAYLYPNLPPLFSTFWKLLLKPENFAPPPPQGTLGTRLYDLYQVK